MSKKRICLAVADSKAEQWIMGEIVKKSGDYEFTKPALHRAAVLDRISFEKPNILIISEGLPIGGSSLSFDALIMTVRTKYQNCRIIILAGKHEVGDAFLNKMVSRGVYDIVMGDYVNLPDVVDCVFHKKDYDYASKLQGLETSLDVENSVGDVNMVEVVEKEKKGLFKRKTSESLVSEPEPSPEPVSESADNPVPPPIMEEDSQAKYEGTTVLRTPDPTFEREKYGTTVLSTTPQTTPKGILFERLEYVYPQSSVDENTQYQNSSQNVQGISEKNAQTVTSDMDGFQNEVQKGNYVSSDTITYSRVLTNEDSTFKSKPIVPANKYLPKIIAFVGARQGVGCSTSLINTAVSLAYSGKRVCVIDAVWNEKSIFDKLGMSHTANGFNNNKNYPLPPGFESSYAVQFPDKSDSGMIQFLEMTTGDIVPEGVLSNIRSLSGYNYILIDMTIGYFNPFSVGLLSLSDQIVAVTNQDGYEMMILKNYLNAYNTEVPVYKKLFVYVNKSNTKLIPNERDIARFLQVSDTFMFPCDNNGHIAASSRDGVYINSCRKKMLKIFGEFVKRIS